MIIKIETKTFTLEIDPTCWTLDTSSHHYAIRKMNSKHDFQFMDEGRRWLLWEVMRVDNSPALEIT